MKLIRSFARPFARPFIHRECVCADCRPTCNRTRRGPTLKRRGGRKKGRGRKAAAESHWMHLAVPITRNKKNKKPAVGEGQTREADSVVGSQSRALLLDCNWQLWCWSRRLWWWWPRCVQSLELIRFERGGGDGQLLSIGCHSCKSARIQ